jgi:hypothetical protein
MLGNSSMILLITYGFGIFKKIKQPMSFLKEPAQNWWFRVGSLREKECKILLKNTSSIRKMYKGV